MTHLLPDGSTVILNADSELSYTASDFDQAREVTLKGEAFFEVTPGSPFLVKGEQGSVEVLGTSFNAYFRNQQLEVSCFTGSVKVSTGESSHMLEPGQLTKSGESEPLSKPATFDQNKVASWRTGEFYFDQVPLSEVLQELQRQFDLEIVYS